MERLATAIERTPTALNADGSVCSPSTIHAMSDANP